MEKKRFTKRIIEESEGYWSYVPYVNQDRWIDIEILLTTRIGFNLQEGVTNINENGKVQIDVYEPTVLNKAWST